MLEIRDITMRYGEKKALDHVSMTLTEGVYGLLGPNGAGKSTLMNIITDNLRSGEGDILWENQEIHSMGKNYRRLLGYAPQQQGLYESFTGLRFLSYMAALKQISRQELKDEIDRVTDCVNLTEVIRHPISSYSGGMKQRLLVAQALLGDPKLIILDEPTAGLDPKERVRLRETIAAQAQGRIVLIATHVVSDVQSIAREIIMLRQGQIVAKDTVAALCRQYEGVQDLESLYMKLFGEEAHREGEAHA